MECKFQYIILCALKNYLSLDLTFTLCSCAYACFWYMYMHVCGHTCAFLWLSTNLKQSHLVTVTEQENQKLLYGGLSLCFLHPLNGSRFLPLGKALFHSFPSGIGICFFYNAYKGYIYKNIYVYFFSCISLLIVTWHCGSYHFKTSLKVSRKWSFYFY